MRRSRSGNPYRAAVAALQAGIADRLKQNAADESLIANLSARAGVEGGTGGITGSAAAMPPKKRRRRRHKSRPVVVRKAKRGTAAKRVGRVAIPVAAPEPVAAPASGNQGKGALLFADRLEELKGLFATIDTNEADAARAYSIIVELKGRCRLPGEYTKAVRMRLKRRAAAATKPVKRAAVSAPKKKKPKAPRKPAVPIPPPIVKRTDWHPDENGTMSREIITS